MRRKIDYATQESRVSGRARLGVIRVGLRVVFFLARVSDMMRLVLVIVTAAVCVSVEATERWTRAFDGCEALRSYLVRTAVQSARAELTGAGLHGPGWGRPATSQDGEGVDFAAAPGGVGDGVKQSETNVQEQGVDELDLIKSSDGYIFLIANGRLQVVDAWPADAAHEVAALALPGEPRGLLLWGRKLAVVSTLTEWAEPAPGGADLGIPPGVYAVTTQVSVFDISQPEAPKLEREVVLEGSFNTARRIDEHLHLVVDNALPAYAFQPMPGLAVRNDAKGRLSATARDALRVFVRDLLSRPLRDLAPEYADRRFGELQTTQHSGVLGRCEDYARPEVPNGTATTSVVTLDLSDPEAPLQSATLISDYGTVYASTENLYIVTANAGPWLRFDGAGGLEDRSEIHKISLGPSPAVAASGEVEGWILNRYAMSEHQGVFRIATTVGQWDRLPLNRLFTLEQRGDALEVLGQSEALGRPGETIYAVRYDGARGYVVTFEQKDPFYTLDLSDPAHPQVVGELEIPGFSTYLHPVGEDRVLAIGQAVDPAGVELSLFDVADFAAPRLLDRVSLGSGTYSAALYEPKAFNYYPTLGRLVTPVSRHGYAEEGDAGALVEDGFNGALVFDLDPALGFSLRGAVEHLLDTSPDYYWNPVQRSLFMGQGDDFALYTLSAQSLQASDADSLAPLSETPLPDAGLEGPIVMF